MASRSLFIALYHTNPRLDGVRVIANKCAITELYLYKKSDYRKTRTKQQLLKITKSIISLENPLPFDRELTGMDYPLFCFLPAML